MQFRGRGIHLHDGQVRIQIRTDHRPVGHEAGGKPHLHGLGTVDHVEVRDNVAVRIIYKSGTLALVGDDRDRARADPLK